MLSAEQKQNYLTAPYHCPYCGSEDISAEPFEGEGSYQPVQCNTCGKEWRDVYNLVDLEETKD